MLLVSSCARNVSMINSARTTLSNSVNDAGKYQNLRNGNMMKSYSIIYADPPWPEHKSSKAWKNTRGLASAHYDTMHIGDIKGYPVNPSNDSFLFLWTTARHIYDAIDVVNSWGFEYKTIAFVWVKVSMSGTPLMGIGNYTRSNAEYVLLGKRGRPKVLDHSIQQIILAPRETHSKKPDVVRDRIIQLCGDVPRIEIFARDRHDGWDSVGNQLK